MVSKIDISTALQILVFGGITVSAPRIINSLDKDTLSLWICILLLFGILLNNLDNKIKELDIKIQSFDIKIKHLEDTSKVPNNTDNHELMKISLQLENLMLTLQGRK
ncbi:MAG: hypothetical protein QG646_952 [Euryarchaeota archaeon]|nr:hypothetical protein [Euryarchaeota archaeon]